MMKDKCPCCGASRKPIDDLLFECGSRDEYVCTDGTKYDFFQSVQCLTTERDALKAKLAAAVDNTYADIYRLLDKESKLMKAEYEETERAGDPDPNLVAMRLSILLLWDKIRRYQSKTSS